MCIRDSFCTFRNIIRHNIWQFSSAVKEIPQLCLQKNSRYGGIIPRCPLDVPKPRRRPPPPQTECSERGIDSHNPLTLHIGPLQRAKGAVGHIADIAVKALFLPRYPPVSYTHLDVYKRQRPPSTFFISRAPAGRGSQMAGSFSTRRFFFFRRIPRASSS